MAARCIGLAAVVFFACAAASFGSEPPYRVTNYEAMEVELDGVSIVDVAVRSVGDPYERCYSAWLTSDAGTTYIPLNGPCDPGDWKSSHCSCPTVVGEARIRYDLSNFVKIPYTGRLVFLISSYVGYWEVQAESVRILKQTIESAAQ